MELSQHIRTLKTGIVRITFNCMTSLFLIKTTNNMKTENEIPRRNQMNLLTLTERSIKTAIHEVELMPADELLTQVVVKLSEAFELLADYVDYKNPNFPGVKKLNSSIPKNELVIPEDSKSIYSKCGCGGNMMPTEDGLVCDVCG
jgi:hypothetical protein